MAISSIDPQRTYFVTFTLTLSRKKSGFGLTFIENKNSEISVLRLESDEDGNPGAAMLCGKIRLEDILIAVEGYLVFQTNYAVALCTHSQRKYNRASFIYCDG